MSENKDNAEIDSLREVLHNLIDKIDNKKYLTYLYKLISEFID